MSALIANLANRWPGQVPYHIPKGDLVGVGGATLNKMWLREKLMEFNRAIDHDVFVAWGGGRSDPNYIEIQVGADSPIGMQGIGKQICRVSSTNIFHELGHAIGLGHTFYTTGSQIHTLFGDNSVDKTNYASGLADYTSNGIPNAPSMMAYSPTAFSTSPRIQRVVALTQGKRSNIGGVIVKVEQRKEQLRLAPRPSPLTAPITPSKALPKRSMDLDSISTKKKTVAVAPRSFDADFGRPKPAVDPNDISKMDKPTIDQLLLDLRLIQTYWTFDDGFMLKVFPTDKDAVRAVLGLGRYS